ncbi:isochorismatase family protein [Dongia soli]|uniref:Isochorismatase family protein n=1 Tax=Dongia soli TaxID=600628 RepID=A0ABU5EEW3_9PROT|nr:isochorismatase family protein [Dongia soli]MDY0884756.1 isochorismatase family protein [Dongia soli]
MRGDLSVPTDQAALLCIDLQEEHRLDKRYLVAGFDQIIGNVRQLQQVARFSGVTVLHAAYIVESGSGASGGAKMRRFHPVMPDGSSAFSDSRNPLSAICKEVAPVGEELVFVKSEASALRKGRLADDLKRRDIDWLFICGVWTEACIDATVKDAVDLGFHVVLIKDACGSGNETMHQTGILNLANRLYGGAVTTTAGACRMMAGEKVDSWMVEGSVPIRYTYETAASIYDAL